MGKSAKFASVRKVGLKNTEARLSTDRQFKRKKRQKKPRIKDAIIARRLERPQTLQSKSISSIFKAVQQNPSLSRGQKRRLASKVRFLRQKRLEQKAVERGAGKQKRKEGGDVEMEEGKEVRTERRSKNQELRRKEQEDISRFQEVVADERFLEAPLSSIASYLRNNLDK